MGQCGVKAPAVDPASAEEDEHRGSGGSLGGDPSLARDGGVLLGPGGPVEAFPVHAEVRERERQVDGGAGPGQRVTVGLLVRLLQVRDSLREVVRQVGDLTQQVQGPGARRPRTVVVQDAPGEFLRSLVRARCKVVQGGLEPEGRLRGATVQRELEELGGVGRCPAQSRVRRRILERCECRWSEKRAAQREVPGALLDIGHCLAEP